MPEGYLHSSPGIIAICIGVGWWCEACLTSTTPMHPASCSVVHSMGCNVEIWCRVVSCLARAKKSLLFPTTHSSSDQGQNLYL